MKPKRIQRKRTKGWKMPANTVNVTRPGKWGNPFDFRRSDCCWLALSYGCRADRLGRQEASVRAFREWIEPPAKGKRTVRYERGVRFGDDKGSFQIGPRFIVGPPPTIIDIRGARDMDPQWARDLRDGSRRFDRAFVMKQTRI